MYGNLQTFPSPTANPRADRKKLHLLSHSSLSGEISLFSMSSEIFTLVSSTVLPPNVKSLSSISEDGKCWPKVEQIIWFSDAYFSNSKVLESWIDLEVKKSFSMLMGNKEGKKHLITYYWGLRWRWCWLTQPYYWRLIFHIPSKKIHH